MAFQNNEEKILKTMRRNTQNRIRAIGIHKENINLNSMYTIHRINSWWVKRYIWKQTQKCKIMIRRILEEHFYNFRNTCIWKVNDNKKRKVNDSLHTFQLQTLKNTNREQDTHRRNIRYQFTHKDAQLC